MRMMLTGHDDDDDADGLVTSDARDLGDGERSGRKATDEGDYRMMRNRVRLGHLSGGAEGGKATLTSCLWVELEGPRAERPDEEGEDSRRNDENDQAEELWTRARQLGLSGGRRALARRDVRIA